MKTVKTTIIIGVALLCKMLTGLVAVKLCARYIGIQDFGLTGQISSLVAIVTLFASGGVTVGLAKIRSESYTGSLAKWINAGRILCVAASAVLFIAFLIARRYISEVVLDNSVHATLIFFVILVAILPIGFGGIAQGLINGGQSGNLYAKSLLVGSAVGILGFLLLSETWGARGSFLGIIWLPMAQSLTVMFYGRRLGQAAPGSSLSLPSYRDVIYLGKFGLLSITAGSTIPLSYIFLRILVQRYVGASDLGLWQATVRLSDAYTQLPMVMLSVIFFSRFASRSKEAVDWIQVRNAYGYVAALMLAIGTFVFLARGILVKILFTSEFSTVSELVPWQVFGDTLRMLSYVGTTILAARGFVKLCILAEVLQGALLCLASIIILPRFGTLGPFIAYVCTYGIYLAFTCFALFYLQSSISKKYATSYS